MHILNTENRRVKLLKLQTTNSVFKKHAQLCTVYIKFSNICENIGTIEIGQ